MHSKLTDSVIVIIGGASGLGRALTLLALEHGANVIAVDVNSESLSSLSSEGNSFPGNLEVATLDITDRVEMKNFIHSLMHKRRKIDYWFNVAAINIIESFFDDNGENSFEKIMDVNFRAQSVIVREVVRYMSVHGSGTVMNIGSILSHIPASFMAPYCAAKAAMLAFSRSLSLELNLLRSPVKVLISNPGYMKTPILKRGEEMGFPEWLLWLASEPSAVAREILDAAVRQIPESYPTRNGRIILRLFRFAPIMTLKLLHRATSATSLKMFILGGSQS